METKNCIGMDRRRSVWFCVAIPIGLLILYHINLEIRRQTITLDPLTAPELQSVLRVPKPPPRNWRYQSKDTRPLTEKTELKPDNSLWLYPLNETGSLNGPWHSQTRQDQMLYRGFFRNTFNGTFVELGAVDGVTFSNTKFFQDSMGWNGLLIEPSSDYEYLVKGQYGYPKHKRGNTYQGPNRCNSSTKCVNAAVCYTEGVVNMTRTQDSLSVGAMVGGLVGYMSEAHRNQFKIGNDQYEVPCKPFGQLLQESGITHIDLLSLDVEGAEEIVLDTMDWSIPIHVIVIESHESNSPTGPEGHERKHRILMENGFRYLQFYYFDEWWVNPNNRRH